MEERWATSLLWVLELLSGLFHDEASLWPQVRGELRWAASLLPLRRRDLGAKWSDHVYATDASHWGRGVAVMTANVDDIKSVGRFHDRWKFNQQEEGFVQEAEEDHLQLPDLSRLRLPRRCCQLWHLAAALARDKGRRMDMFP